MSFGIVLASDVPFVKSFKKTENKFTILRNLICLSHVK
jgi:hypothetical protein